jgi:septation ring formation regulator EzrA
MADLVTGLRQVIQDLVALDMKAIQAKQDSLSKQVELQYDALRRQIEVRAKKTIAGEPLAKFH